MTQEYGSRGNHAGYVKDGKKSCSRIKSVTFAFNTSHGHFQDRIVINEFDFKNGFLRGRPYNNSAIQINEL